MTARDDIATAVRAAVSLLGATGWQYRQRTNAMSVATPTYGAYVNIAGHETARRFSQEWDEEREQYVRRETLNFRVSDATAALVIGDELKDPDGVVWGIAEVDTSGVGTRRYLAERVHPIKQTSRGGGPV